MESGNINIKNVDLKKQMKDSYLDYAMSVIVSRALPDIRDGLKPVHRRIIYGMSELSLTPDKSYRKSARLVGDVLGKYHPHGDTAVYEAMVRLAQDFSTRYLLVDGQGNFGSIDGDGAAAMRYTEVRMTKLTLEMLRDISKNTVDFKLNFDESEKEPVVLPSRFPNLLVNGSSGIAVGMATNMPPHNIEEVIDGVIKYIDNPDIEMEDLIKIIKGPDFPTGGMIMGTEGIRKAYETGRGKVIIRAVAEIEEKNGKNRIIVSEIPYQVNKANLIIKIADLVKDKKIDGISDLRDESDRDGMRIVIELKRDANPEIVLNNLYKYTQMQTTFGIINLALVNNEPKILNLKELIYYYLEHQKDVITRRCQFDLKKAEDRVHIIEGLLKAIDNIDEIIKIIRSSYSDAAEKLIERFDFSVIQAQAILEMRLRRLQGLEREKLEDEYNELLSQIKRLKEILGSEVLLLNLIKSELNEIKDRFKDKRRTAIKSAVGEINIEELINEEDVLITLTNHGYIKRTPANSYKVQNRGGKGVMGLTTKEDDFVETLFVTSTHNTILFFTNKGRVYNLKAYEIPEGKRQAKGQMIINILDIDKDEKVTAVIPLVGNEKDSSLFMVTKKGMVKKVELSNFENIRKIGIKAITLVEEDELIGVRICEDDTDAMIITKKGQSIRFMTSSIRNTGRTSIGVRGIRLSKEDEVVSTDLVKNNEYLLVVSENGYGKKTLIQRYNTQNRGGKGVRTYNISEKTGCLVSAKLVGIEDEIIIISLKGDIIRLNVKDVSTKGRDTMGVILKDVKNKEDRIVAVAKYIEDIES